MKFARTNTKKEVSCKALLPLFVAVEESQIDYNLFLKGVPYTLSYLRNKHERIEWCVYCTMVENLRSFFSPSDFEAMGVKQIKEKRFTEILIAGFFLFSTSTVFRILANKALKVGRQLFDCVDYNTEYLAANRLRITLTMATGYTPLPEFFLITKGTWYQLGQLARKGFKLQCTLQGGQCIYDMMWEKEGILFRVKRRLRWLIYVRNALNELTASNEVLLKQYDELVESKKKLDQQSTLLRTALEITKSIRQRTELGSTLKAITDSLVQEARFASATIKLFKDVEGNDLAIECTSRDETPGTAVIARFIRVESEMIGELTISTVAGIGEQDRDDLLGYLMPIVCIAIHDSLVLRAVMDYRNNLERKVQERTAELMKAEDELSRTIALLEAAREEQNRFFVNISHEFRTPLTLIEGPVMQLLRGTFTGNVNEQYGLILRNTRQLLHLVNQLLDLSKVESGEMKRHVSEQDLAAVVRWIGAGFESTARQKGIEFAIDGVHEPIVGWFDRDAVEKIVANLISNAIKFTGGGGFVHVTVRHYSSGLQHDAGICVTDSGIGIPSKEIDQIFNRFYQVEAARNHEYDGTGIGLALTKELVELNHGGIHVSSEFGKGSMFSVWFPLGKEYVRPEEIVPDAPEITVASRPDTPTASEVTSTSQDSICLCDVSLPLLLIVEDNKDLRMYVRSIFGSSFRIFECSNGEEGFQKAIEIVPDAIISDVMMPKMDGFGLCRSLKTDERTSHIPVILLTAKAEMDQKIEGLGTGADAYLTKPFEARELLVRMKNLIDQRRRLRERFGKEIKLKASDVAITSADERFINKALELVEAHINDSAFTAEMFAREMFLSQMQLHRKIKAVTNCSPWEFVRTIRLERASKLLQKGAGTVAEIAYQVSYSDPSHFADAFRKQFGVSPSEFAHQRQKSIETRT